MCSVALVTMVMKCNDKLKNFSVYHQIAVFKACSVIIFSVLLSRHRSVNPSNRHIQTPSSPRGLAREVFCWLFLRTTLSPQAAPPHTQWNSSCMVNILHMFTALVQWDCIVRQMLIYMWTLASFSVAFKFLQGLPAVWWVNSRDTNLIQKLIGREKPFKNHSICRYDASWHPSCKYVLGQSCFLGRKP